MKATARVVGRGRPMPLEEITGRLPPGRFGGGPFVRLTGVHAEGVDFSGRHFEYFAVEGSTLIDCDFSRCRFESGSFDASRTSLFLRCRFDQLRPKSAIWGVSHFEACSFEQMRLDDWRPDSAEFVDCHFSGRIEAYFSGVPQFPYDSPDRMIPWRTRNEFRGNDFSRAELRFPDFRWGVDLSANTWPPAPEYLYLDRWQERLIRAIAAVSRWEEDAMRERALWWLRSERSDGREQQAQTLFRPADWENLEPKATWERLWPILKAPLP